MSPDRPRRCGRRRTGAVGADPIGRPKPQVRPGSGRPIGVGVAAASRWRCSRCELVTKLVAVVVGKRSCTSCRPASGHDRFRAVAAGVVWTIVAGAWLAARIAERSVSAVNRPSRCRGVAGPVARPGGGVARTGSRWLPGPLIYWPATAAALRCSSSAGGGCAATAAGSVSSGVSDSGRRRAARHRRRSRPDCGVRAGAGPDDPRRPRPAGRRETPHHDPPRARTRRTAPAGIDHRAAPCWWSGRRSQASRRC